MNKRILRKFGFFKDQDGIINRYLREADVWNAHLDKTKQYILNASANKKKGKACIIGSGWLLDVPFKELSETFNEIIFIDIKHPRQVVHQLRNYKNIKLIEADITGLAEPIYQTIKEFKKSKTKTLLNEILPQHSAEVMEEIKQSDFVVSVNILNQLDILLCDYVLKTGLYNDEELITLRKYIQNKHIELLPKGRTALITDYEEHNIDNQDQVVKRKNLVHITLPESTQMVRWTWDFDLKKTYHQGFVTIFKVMAIEF